MDISEPLQSFYAVTISRSLYFVKIDTCKPSMTKFQGEANPNLETGKEIQGGPMIAIAKGLYFFTPEGGGITSMQREIAEVNTRWWGMNTSFIVGLFLTQEDALQCLSQSDFVPCDPRWEENTIQVLRAVGEEHHFCTISKTSPDLWLLPPEKWRQS